MIPLMLNNAYLAFVDRTYYIICPRRSYRSMTNVTIYGKNNDFNPFEGNLSGGAVV